MMEKLSERINDFTSYEYKSNETFWSEATHLLRQAHSELQPKIFRDKDWFEAMTAGFLQMRKRDRTQRAARKLIQLLKWTAYQLKLFGE